MATIYKILSPCLQECYVGSTTQPIQRRWSCHICNSNKTASKVLFEKYGSDNCKIVILEVCELEEQLSKEQWWIDHSVGVVNYRNTIHDAKSYNKKYAEDNKEAIRIRKKLWHENYMKSRSPEEIARKKTYMKEYQNPARPLLCR